MPSTETPQLIKYSITPASGSILLRIWEPAPVTSSRIKPFLFMARYRLRSEEEAAEILEYYRTACESVG